MKKNGFTLAEIVITLSIIGFVAALTLPSLHANLQKQANASKLGASVNALENAFGMMIIKEEVEDIDKTSFWSDNNDKFTEKAFNKYLNVKSTTDEIKGFTSSYKFQLKNGANIGITNKNLYIDVNGINTPNRLGEDIFTFTISAEDGKLIPSGAAETLAKNNYKYKAEN